MDTTTTAETEARGIATEIGYEIGPAPMGPPIGEHTTGEVVLGLDGAGLWEVLHWPTTLRRLKVIAGQEEAIDFEAEARKMAEEAPIEILLGTGQWDPIANQSMVKIIVTGQEVYSASHWGQVVEWLESSRTLPEDIETK